MAPVDHADAEQRRNVHSSKSNDGAGDTGTCPAARFELRVIGLCGVRIPVDPPATSPPFDGCTVG